MTTPGRPVMFRAGRAEMPAAAPAAQIVPHFTDDVVLLADLSEFQPALADAVYLAWSKAIIIRAMYGGQHDDKAWYGGQRRDLLHAGGVRFLGIYQYVVAGQAVKTQAQELIRLVGTMRPGEKIIGDFEEGAGDQKIRRDVWASAVAAGLGDRPWTYSGLNFAAAHDLAPVDWVAAYGTAEPAEPHTLWQFTDAFTVPGVGTADCSVFHGSIDQLAALAYQGAQPQQPKPGIAGEDDAMIVLDALYAGGPAVVLPVPAGARTLTLYADDGYASAGAPQVRVVFAGPGHGVAEVTPAWAAPAVLSVPAGSGSVSLARLGTVATPVTAGWS